MQSQAQAYDLTRFEQTQGRIREERNMRVVNNEDKKSLRRQKMHGVKLVALAALMMALVCSLLYSQTMVTQLTREVAFVNKAILEAKSENAYLSNEMELKANMKNIEQRAAQLGLVKMNPSQITYITIAKENKIVLPESGAKKTFDGMRTGLMSFMEYLAP